jgi:HEAT repeat protein
MLRDVEPNSKSRQTLVGMGRRAFPVYEAILSDPKSDPYSVERTFAILREVDADRRQFLEYAVQRLADANSDIRAAALFLLEKIGSPRDAQPVVALLSDKKSLIAEAAATVLLALGDQRTVVAMDVWLNSESHRDKEWLRKHVAKCRAELKQRLGKAKKTGN